MSGALSETNGQALVRAKRTFLEFTFCPYDNSDRVRRLSEPSCIARPSATEDLCTSCSEDHVLWSSHDINSDSDACEHLIEEDLLEDESCHGRLMPQTSKFADVTPNVVQVNALETLYMCTEAQTEKLCTMLPIPGRAIMKTKATFLEFKFIAYEDSPPLRRNSMPPCFGFRCIDKNMRMAEAPHVESDSQVLWASEDIVSQPDADEHQQVLADVLSEKSGVDDADGDMSLLGVKHKSPSKAKRDNARHQARHLRGMRMRYKKFMLQLCERVNENPEGFDIALIRWPPALLDNKETREYLIDILESHRARALRGFTAKDDMYNKVSLKLESVL